MSMWLWISIIVIVIFIVIFLIAWLVPDEVLDKNSIGRMIKEACNTCKRVFQRKEKDEYGLGFLRK